MLGTCGARRGSSGPSSWTRIPAASVALQRQLRDSALVSSRKCCSTGSVASVVAPGVGCGVCVRRVRVEIWQQGVMCGSKG
jgi:hypothetical protein